MHIPIKNPFCCFNFFNIPTIYNNFKKGDIWFRRYAYGLDLFGYKRNKNQPILVLIYPILMIKK